MRYTKAVWIAWPLGIATALTILATAQGYASRRVEGQPASLKVLLISEAGSWFAWALLVPAILAIDNGVRRRGLSGFAALATHAIAAVALLAGHTLLEVAIKRPLGVVPMRIPLGELILARFSGTIVPNVLILVMVVLGLRVADHYRETQLRRVEEAELRTQLADAQLRVLRMQLQPHFLFNALHTVSALMLRDVQQARRVLTRLGDLLRTTLAHSERQEIPLDEELAFLTSYLEIQRARFDDRLRVQFAVNPSCVSAHVPTHLLQPLVENAVRHAIEPRKGPGTIRISAFRDGSTLHLVVADNGPGMSAPEPAGPRFGTGLSNTIERLRSMYGDRQTLTFGVAPEGGLEVHLSIPYRNGIRGSDSHAMGIGQ